MPAAHWVLFGIFALMAGLGVAFLVWRRKAKRDKLDRRISNSIASLLITMGLVGLLMRGFDYERVYLLSMRFFYVIWLLAAGVWGWTIYIYATKTVPAIRAKQAEREQHEKWLPKKK